MLKILEVEIKKELERILKKITKQRNNLNPDFDIQYPPQEKFGHFSTNLAMKMAPVLKLMPQAIANEIIKEISKDSFFKKNFSKIEIAPPAFINFHLSKETQIKTLKDIIKQKEKFTKLNFGRNKKVQIEFISANPTGEPTLGNARGAFLGDVLANVLDAAGFKVEREYYINNAASSKQIRELGKTLLGQGQVYLTPQLQKLIDELKKELKNKKIRNEGEAGYLLSKKILEKTKEFITKDLKIKFDQWFEEEWLYHKKEIEKALNLLQKTNYTYKKGGAIWLKTSELGDEEDRVLIRNDGEPTYFLSDIAYHLNKFNRGFEKVIDIWGADHQSHVTRMRAALQILGINPKKLDIIITQMMNLKRGGKILKLSKRKGVVVTLEELVNLIGLDASRYFFISVSADSQMTFDLELVKKQSEDNPFYYMQYAYVRAGRIIEKSDQKIKKSDLKTLKEKEELSLIYSLNKIPYIIKKISDDYQVQQLNQTGLEISQKFHNFYEKCRVINEDKKITQARLNLMVAVRIALKRLFDLMGISVPKRM
jgi:arginyl-tRNA synthetase